MFNSERFQPPFDRVHSENIRGWIEEAIKTGAESFDDLVENLPGVYPAEIASALDENQDIGIAVSDRSPISIEFGTLSPETVEQRSKLPVPHPLDFDWRFSTLAVERLIDRFEQLGILNPRVALVGTPSLYMPMKKSVPSTAIELFEANQVMVGAIQALSSSALTNVHRVESLVQKENSVDVAILDPPWYPEITEPFIAQAAAMTRINGTIWIAMPPVGTRPNITREIENTIGYAKSVGLRLVKIDKDWLPYDAPPFEINALSAVGITEIDPEWRKADLYTFRRGPGSIDNAQLSNKTLTIPESDEGWEEVIVGRVRLRIKKSSCSGGSIGLNSIVEGDVMPSVSRRALGREFANVWTSGNRIFRAERPDQIVNILRHISASRKDEDLRIDGTVSPGSIHDLHETLRNLVELESRELRNYGWG